MVVGKPGKCQRCLLGIDDDGDGDCGVCHNMDARTAEKVKWAVERLLV